MNIFDALNDLARQLDEFNRAELLCSLPILSEQDRTHGEWVTELQWRVNAVEMLEPSQESLDRLGAVVLAMKINLANAETTRIHTGEEAA